VSEIAVPGGSVDFFLVSARDDRPVDFVGIEFQTLDTTGTVWPARQEFLRSVGLNAPIAADASDKSYGVNWKMTAKTILMQLHHKVQTFEGLGRNLVLVVQDLFMNYMAANFEFGHLTSPASIGDAMQFHAYNVREKGDELALSLADRKSTTAAGIAQALNLGTAAGVEEEEILRAITAKMSDETRWTPVT
jgi:hypothetical protein